MATRLSIQPRGDSILQTVWTVKTTIAPNLRGNCFRLKLVPQAMMQGPFISTNHRPAAIVTDLSYSLLALGSATLWSVSSGWLVYFYLPPNGDPRVPVSVFGVVVFAVYVIHAPFDPLVGYLSDHTRSRWGRRLPFMLLSSLPMLLCFVLLFTPPSQLASGWNLLYLATVLLFYRTLSSLHQIPYQALLPELALSDAHRVRLSTWSAAFQILGMILASLAGPAVDAWGYLTTMAIYSGALLPLFYLPLLVLRERQGRQIAPTARLGLRKNIATTLGNRGFRIFIAARTLCWATTGLLQAVIPFIVTEICLLPRSDAVYFYLAGVLVSLAFYPLITRVSIRAGKQRVFAASLLASTIVLPALMLIGEWLPVPLAAQGLVWVALEGIALSGFTVLQSAFIAEITDDDETLTGQRREGSYYAAVRFLDQLVGGAASALLPLLLLLGRSRFDPHGPLGVRIVGLAGGLLTLAAYVIFLRYPLKDRRARSPHNATRPRTDQRTVSDSSSVLGTGSTAESIDRRDRLVKM
jgi:GPH family glycoside/pentoside/hexuronide:cation symporter